MSNSGEAREAFDACVIGGADGTVDTSEIQRRLAAWQGQNFGAPTTTVELLALGVCEEAGELAHAVLKRAQGIRGMDRDAAREAIADAAGDIMVYLCNLLTAERMDLGTVLRLVAEDVMHRDWKASPLNGESVS